MTIPFGGIPLTLGEFRKMTKDMSDDTLIVREANYPQVENVLFEHKPIGKTVGENHPFTDAGYEQKYSQGGVDKIRKYEQLPNALVISRYRP